MTYNVFSGMLNPTQSINQSINLILAVPRACVNRNPVLDRVSLYFITGRSFSLQNCPWHRRIWTPI